MVKRKILLDNLAVWPRDTDFGSIEGIQAQKKIVDGQQEGEDRLAIQRTRLFICHLAVNREDNGRGTPDDA